MHLHDVIKLHLLQLTKVLGQLSTDEYTMPAPVILNATVGQHVRHVIELFIEMENGYASSVINYNKRKRDHRMETDPHFASNRLEAVLAGLEKENKPLMLETGYNDSGTNSALVATNYHRELVYNLEHTVHHMALIRIGINAVSLISVPPDFGVALSTTKYRATCAQ